MQPIVVMEVATPMPMRPRPIPQRVGGVAPVMELAPPMAVRPRPIPLRIGEVAPIKRVDAYNTVKDDQGNSVFNFWNG